MNRPYLLMLFSMLAACHRGAETPRESERTHTLESSGRAGSASLQLAVDTLDERLCRDITNSYKCAQAIEQHLLEHGVPGVERRAAELVIRLNNGDSIIFRDSTQDNPSGFWHSYRAFLSSLAYHVVEIQYYEGGTYLMVSARSGKRTFINAFPIPSPDGQRIAAANVDLEAEYSPTTLQVWRLDQDNLVLEWEHDFLADYAPPDSTWGPADLTWMAPNELGMARQYSAGERRGQASLSLGPNGWTLIER